MPVKLIEFPKEATKITWLEALQGFIDNADDEVKNLKVRNLVIISETDEDYHFGILNSREVRSLIGTLQCVNQYLIDYSSPEFDE
jgi:hypothetical protein